VKKKLSCQYLENLGEDEIVSLKTAMNQLQYDTKEPEEWATYLGQLYVNRYGYPSGYDTYFGIGSSLIYYFKNSEEQAE